MKQSQLFNQMLTVTWVVMVQKANFTKTRDRKGLRNKRFPAKLGFRYRALDTLGDMLDTKLEEVTKGLRV